MLGFSRDYTKLVMCKSGASPGVIKHLELNTHMKGAFFPFQKQFSVEGVCEMCGVPHLHGLILHPCVWELLMKQVCFPRFQVVAVPGLWCCTPRYALSVRADFSLCTASFPQRTVTCDALHCSCAKVCVTAAG